MENNQHKFWEKLESEVRNYEPEEFTPADWDDMKELLGKQPVSGLPASDLSYLKSLLLLVVLGAFILSVGAYILSPEKESDQISETLITTTTIEKSKTNPNQKEVISSTVNRSEIEETPIVPQQVLSKVERSSASGSLPKMTPSGDAGLMTVTDPSAHSLANHTNSNNASLNQANTIQENLLLSIDEAATSRGQNIQNSSASLGESVTENEVKERKPGQVLPFLAVKSFEVIPPTRVLSKSIAQDQVVSSVVGAKWTTGFTLGINTTITDYERNTFSVLPFLGLFARRNITSSLELQLGIEYKPVDSYNETQFYEEEVYNSLGYVGYDAYKVTYQGYSAFEVPITLKYAASKQLGLTFGTRLSHLAKGPTATGSSGNNSYNPPLYQRAPNKGFWSTDIGVVAGVEYFLNNKWLLTVNYTQGIRDITPDNLYNNTKTHLNSDLQIATQYMF